MEDNKGNLKLGPLLHSVHVLLTSDKPRVGVWVRTGVNSGEPQGFVFITLNSSLQQLRESIRDQVGWFQKITASLKEDM